MINKRLFSNRIIFPVLSLCVFLPNVSYAEAWQLRPTIVLEERVHDNIDLVSQSPTAGAESLFKGSLSFRRLSETSKIDGRYHLDLSTEKPLRQYITLNSFKKFELNEISMKGYFRRDSTSRSFETISEEVIDPEIDPDEGVVTIELKRNTLKLAPNFRYVLNEKTSFNVGYTLQRVFYTNNQTGSGLFDYNQQGISTSVSRNLSERDVLTTTVGFSRYSADDNINTSGKNYLAMLGYRHFISELTQAGITVGTRRTDLTSSSEDFSNTGFTLRADWNTRFELSKLSLIAQRSVIPSGTSGLLEVTEFKATANHKFRQRLYGAFVFRGFERERLSDTGSRKQYNIQASPRISWKLTRWWTVSTGYRYQQREIIDSSDNDVVNNIVFVQLRYSKGMEL